MKKWKKIGIGLVTAIAVVTALAGCNGAKKEVSSIDSEVTLRFSWWGNDDRHQVTLQAMREYEKEHPNVKLKGEYSGFGNLEEKITTQMAGGTEADITTLLYNWVTKFSPNGDGFYDLNELKEELDLSQYDEEFLKFGMANGKLNAIPLGKNVMSIALNKSAFDRLGLEIPETWDAYKEAAKKFPEGSFLLVAPTMRFAATIFLQQKTGKSEFDEKGNMNYTEEDYKDAMEWYKDLVDARVFCSRQDYLENVGTEPVSLAQNAKFIEGKYVGVIEWNGGLASYEATLKEKGDELVLGPIPKIEGAKTTGSIAKPTMLFAISKNSKSPKEAAKFLNYILNNPGAAKTLGVSRGVPENALAVKVLEEDGQISGVVKEAYEFGKTVEAINQTPIYEDGTLTMIFQQHMENLELGKSNLADASHELYIQTKAQAEKLSKSQN